MIKELLEKIGSYNIFNYLLPGIVFSYIASELTRFYFLQNDFIAGAFVYYFIGLVISRLGSIIFQPILEFIFRIKYATYKDFLTAAKTDPKIEILSEANNMYRTFFSLFCTLIFIMLYEKLEYYFPSLQAHAPLALIIFLVLIFGFSYKKQTQFITNRIKAEL